MLETSDRRHVFRVERSIIVELDARWVLDGDPRLDADRQLVITTCTPPYAARDRLIVFASLVRSVAADQPTQT